MAVMEDINEATMCLENHNLPTNFSARQCYFAGRKVGMRKLVGFLDSRFLLWQDDPMRYTIKMLRRDWHKWLEDNGIEWRGGW